MPVEEIEFIIKPDGEVEERVRGVKGHGCESLTKGIEERLGEIKGREHTGEYYEQSIIQEVKTTTR